MDLLVFLACPAEHAERFPVGTAKVASTSHVFSLRVQARRRQSSTEPLVQVCLSSPPDTHVAIRRGVYAALGVLPELFVSLKGVLPPLVIWCQHIVLVVTSSPAQLPIEGGSAALAAAVAALSLLSNCRPSPHKAVTGQVRRQPLGLESQAP